jgi:peptidoglycan/xylan/chitin deacetylase (PgdA/CDA1 family)
MRRLILGFAFIAPLLLIVLWMRGLALLGVAVLALSHALLLIPTLLPNVQWLGPVVTRFASGGNQVWLTIDDGPTEDTPALLDALDARGVKATFFVKGVLAAAHPERVQAIVERGHTIGNHSHTHPSSTFWCLGPRAIADEIDRCAAVIPPTSWFRAPVGMKNPFVHPRLAERNLRLIGWSVRGFDATRDEEEAVVRCIIARVNGGAIVVMHQGRSWSVRTIARVVDELRSRGYELIVPVLDAEAASHREARNGARPMKRK